MNYVYKKKANIDLPRSSYDIAKIGTAKFSNLEVGDLLFFKTTSKARISHVGIYIGNNKFIHASSSKRGVVISELEGYYKKTFKWGVSVVNKKK
ncbi:C40 family peptidase [Sneathia vaginalis]|uniref:C40 family peptidase n=1 Tax=Sneathia vaginalis TaxID=187101 RepID=UPI0035C6CB1D